MKLRTISLFAVAAVLGAAVAVLPALGASSSISLEVNENCNNYTNWPCWTLPGSSPTYASTVTIASGGTITFTDMQTAADIVWRGAKMPTCSGIPASPTSGWTGSCTFEAPGEYEFTSATLYPTYRTYRVRVEGAGGGGTTSGGGGGTTSGGGGTTPTGTGSGTTPTGTGTTPKGSGGSGSSGSSNSPSGSQTSGSGGGGATTPVGSVFVGNASTAVKLPAAQHGTTVHGAVSVAQGGAGGQLEVSLLAARASLASFAHSARVQVGHVSRSSLHAGTVAFNVRLNAKAAHVLRVRGHLALTVKIVLVPAHGSAVALTRSVVLHD